MQVSRIEVVLPGSFNPLHVGHVSLLETAASSVGLPDTSIETGAAVFELGVANADKGVLHHDEVIERIQDFFLIGASVVISATQHTFVSKAQVLPIFILHLLCCYTVHTTTPLTLFTFFASCMHTAASWAQVRSWLRHRH